MFREKLTQCKGSRGFCFDQLSGDEVNTTRRWLPAYQTSIFPLLLKPHNQILR